MDDILVGEFKAAMRRLAATVNFVTTYDEGVGHGMPATAVCSLSMEPPSLLVCINRTASMHAPTARSRFFCVNVMAADQADLCNQFVALKGADRFGAGEWGTGPHGLPWLKGAAANLFCQVDQALDYGTHTIFIGRVEQVTLGSDPATLVFAGGAMGRFVAAASD